MEKGTLEYKGKEYSTSQPHRTTGPKGAKNRLAIVDYDSIFSEGIEKKVKQFNKDNPGQAYKVDTYKASELENLAHIGETDRLIHTGGKGDPIKGNISANTLYICHSHQWKAEQEGGKVERLSDYQKGKGYMEIKTDDPVVGEQGQAAIEKYHTLAVTEAPKNAEVIATSKQTLEGGKEVETAEAIRYDDGSISVQGHPGGKTPSYIIDNFLKTEGYSNKKAA